MRVLGVVLVAWVLSVLGAAFHAVHSRADGTRATSLGAARSPLTRGVGRGSSLQP